MSLVALLCGDAETVSGGTRQHQNASSEASSRYSRSTVPKGMGGQVVADAADVGNLGGNASSHALEQCPVKLGHLGTHDVDGVDAANDAGPVVGALALAHAGGAEIRHDGKVLLDGQTGLVDLLAHDGIGLTQRLEAVAVRWHRSSGRPGRGRGTAGARPCSQAGRARGRQRGPRPCTAA